MLHHWRDPSAEARHTAGWVESGPNLRMRYWLTRSDVVRDEEPAQLLTYRIERLTLRSEDAQTLPLTQPALAGRDGIRTRNGWIE